METRTALALPPLVEAIEGDLIQAAEAIEGVAGFLAALRENVGWLPDVSADINGVKSALESHATRLRSAASNARQRLDGEAPTPPITEQRNDALAERIRLEKSA